MGIHKEKGTRLGLMIGYNLIKSNNGNCKVLSKARENTSFIILLTDFKIE